MSNRIELEIVALSTSSLQSQTYVVVLGEVNGVRKLPIVIGVNEAQAIAVILENMRSTRPLTHDLMKNLMDSTHIQLTEVIISKIQEGVFYAKLICKFNHTDIEIDSRTSDALALAVRFDCPIYTYSSILDNAGIQPDKESTQKDLPQNELSNLSPSEKEEFNIKKMTVAELQNKLNEALETEDYIKAAKIRDEINSRK
ncbi:MAG TPA: bifunctional nuclease family protein [Chitinophagaceae bacterium]|nr:bifunctional nuclease family protein [Chitinophagaceae bacterium]